MKSRAAKKSMASVDMQIDGLKGVIERLRREGKVQIAVLYGSFARGTPHSRSDVDLAIWLEVPTQEEEIEAIDEILMCFDRDVSILRLDDEDESPFVIQEALRGRHLVEPDQDAMYAVSHRVLHQSESIRFRREQPGEAR